MMTWSFVVRLKVVLPARIMVGEGRDRLVPTTRWVSALPALD